MNDDRLRLVTTNDFVGSFFVRQASFGAIPGASALVETVNRLREDGPALWVDCGDFAQGGPLGPASAGCVGFVAVNELGIDIATVGNHEFDWGVRHLRRWIAETRFPVVCANCDVGLPAAAILTAGPWSVGVIGLTHPELASFHGGLVSTQANLSAIVQAEATRLRQAGADLVVVALHDGVDWSWNDDGTIQSRPERLDGLIATFAPQVDVVLGGHTLGRLVGQLGGVPFVQPWAFGVELGVADCFPDGRVELSTESVRGNTDWTGTGAGLHAALTREVVGQLITPLVNAPMIDRSLLDAVAWGMRQTTGADVALVSPAEFQTMQPPLDGAFAYLPAGPVTEADILRAIPWLDDSLCVAEVTPEEVQNLTTLLAEPESWADFGPPVVSGQITGGSGKLVLNGWQARRLTERLRRPLFWTRVGGQREALRAAVAR